VLGDVAPLVEGDPQGRLLERDIVEVADTVFLGESLGDDHLHRRPVVEQGNRPQTGDRLGEGFAALGGDAQFGVVGNAQFDLALVQQRDVGQPAAGGLVGNVRAGVGRLHRPVDADAEHCP
jgi:hypothetical protein